MLVKLALGNVRKSSRDYMIYFITIAFSVALLYAFNTIDTHVDMLPHRRRMIQTIDSLMDVLSYVLMVALALLIIYANNYLIRRRSKEFALYQIFGMRRRNVATILTIETFLSSLSALVVGLGLGVLLSQFLVFVTGRILQETVSNYHFIFRPEVVLTTVIAFGIIFLLTLLLNLLTLRRFQLADLVKRARANEVSRLQSRWVTLGLFIGALVLIGVAYWRLIDIGYPFEVLSYGDNEKTASAWANFGVTTALVCAGTYMLFYSFGGALLYFARASRTVYWRRLNMFTVREFASKIKSSALSMGSISIVLFLMLGVITPAFGVSTSVRQAIEKNAPYAATFDMNYQEFSLDEGYFSSMDATAAYTISVSLEDVRKTLDEKGIFTGSTASDEGIYSGTLMGKPARMVITPFVAASYMSDDEGNPVSEDYSVLSLADYIKASGYDTSQWGYVIDKEIGDYNYSSFEVVPISAYNTRRAFVGLEPMTVNDGEYAVAFSFNFSGLRDMYASALDSGLEIELAGQTVKPAGGASTAFDDSAAAIFKEDFIVQNTGMLIVSDSLFDEISKQKDTYVQVYVAAVFDGDSQNLPSGQSIEYFYDPFALTEEELENKEVVGGWFMGVASTYSDTVEYAVEFLGTVTYVSIYVAFVLAMISAAMLAIQILSSMSEAAPRYRRLSQIGASRRDENRSIAVQVACYFLLPLLVAACHAWVAVGEAVDFIEFVVPVSIGRGVLVTAALVLGIYGVYALVSYWSAKSVISSEANLTER